MLPRNHPDRPPLGGQCRADPSGLGNSSQSAARKRTNWAVERSSFQKGYLATASFSMGVVSSITQIKLIPPTM